MKISGDEDAEERENSKDIVGKLCFCRSEKGNRNETEEGYKGDEMVIKQVCVMCVKPIGCFFEWPDDAWNEIDPRKKEEEDWNVVVGWPCLIFDNPKKPVPSVIF